MKKSTKSLLTSLFAASAMTCLLAVNAIAAESPAVMIGGVELKEGQYLANGAEAASDTQPGSGGYVYYEEATADAYNIYTVRLCMNNYEYDGERYHYVGGNTALIYADAVLEIKLEGKNFLSFPEGVLGVDSCGIYTGWDLYICGDEKNDLLTVTGCDTGIKVDDLYVSECTVDVPYIFSDGYNSTGISVRDADIRAMGGGFYTYGNITVNGNSLVTAANVFDYRAVSLGRLYSKIILNGVSVLWPENAKTAKYGLLKEDGTNAHAVVIGPSDGTLCDHTSLSDWQKNAEFHWKSCTGTDCFLPEDVRFSPVYEVHEFNSENRCEECGLLRTELLVGESFFVPGDYLSNNGTVSAEKPADSGYAYYSAEDGKLYLNNYVYTGSGVKLSNIYPDINGTVLFFSQRDIEVVLTGENSLAFSGNGFFALGMMGMGDLAVSGDGKLEITMPDRGIDAAGAVTISGSTVRIAAEHTGIYAGETICITGNADVSVDSNYVGLCTEEFELNESSLYIKARSRAADIYRKVTVNGEVIVDEKLEDSSISVPITAEILEKGNMQVKIPANGICVIVYRTYEYIYLFGDMTPGTQSGDLSELDIDYIPVKDEETSDEETPDEENEENKKPGFSMPELNLTGIRYIENGKTTILPSALGSRRTFRFGDNIADVRINGESVGAVEKYTVVVIGPMTVEVIYED